MKRSVKFEALLLEAAITIFKYGYSVETINAKNPDEVTEYGIILDHPDKLIDLVNILKKGLNYPW